MFSQEIKKDSFEVKVSERFDVGYVSTPLYVHDDEQFLIVSKTRDSIHLRVFNRENLELISQNAYAAFPKGIGFKGIYSIKQLHHRFFLFYFFEDPLRDVQDIFIQEIDSKTGVFVGDSKHIYAIKNSNSFNKVNITVDKVQNRFIIHYYRMIKYQNDPTFYYEYSLILFDAVGNIINGYTYVPPYSIQKINDIKGALDSNGDIHLIVQLKLKDDDDNARYDRVRIPLNSGEVEVFSENAVYSPYLDPDILVEKEKGKMLIAGLYSNSNKKTRNGFFIMEYDKQDSILTRVKIDIPLNCINNYTSGKDQNKRNKKENSGQNVGIENLQIRELISTKDSTYLLVAERYEESKSDIAIYRYKELYITKVNAKFQVEWSVKIPKHQSSNAAFGYKYIADGKDHVFIFNDNAENLLLVNSEYPEAIKEYEHGVLMACTIKDEDGRMKKDVFLDLRDYADYDLDVINISKVIYAVGDGECVFLNSTINGEFVVFRVKRKNGT